MGKSTTDLKTFWLNGLRKDCLSLYSDEAKAIDELFNLVEYHSRSIDGTAELCRIGKSIESSLITGLPLVLPFGFMNRRKVGSSLPQAGYFLFSRVFHCVTSVPLFIRRKLGTKEVLGYYEPEDPCCEPTYCSRFPRSELNSYACAVWMLRQIFLLFSKREDLPTIAQEEEEICAFVERVTKKPDIRLTHYEVRQARRFLREVFMDGDELHPSLENWLVNPYGRHGPGAVYDGAQGTAKWSFSPMMTSLKTHEEFIVPTTEMPAVSRARLAIVPKDFRKHRLICIEQKEMMFQQQGLRSVLEFLTAQSPFASRCIAFDDQSRNYQLSRNTQYSTLDLSDASDLLSRRLCKLLLPREIYKLLVMCRSARIELPDSSLIAYESMYTMGNALCFTIESLIFAALTASVISNYAGCGLLESCRRFRVFGDDLIVKSEYYQYLYDVLQRAGLKPNIEKCCHDTLIRESCGSWFVQGIDVRILRPREMTVSCDSDWVAALQMSKNLAEYGCLQTAEQLLLAITEYYPTPNGFFGLPGDKNVTRQMLKEKRCYRYNSVLQREEMLIPTQKGDNSCISRPAGERGIYAYFTGQATKFFQRLITVREWTGLE